ncbi:MAG: sodium:solute symporter family protein [Candidatus Eremiobacteraeota bacterium]|nr:sodium:solute symporter family protein [Candidatus Eremiobacteraeota bacterium]
MHLIDYVIFGLYMLCVLGVGFYYYFQNKNAEDYYVGGRTMSPYHVGISVVATDVGGGFSIGLGGVGFLMGLAGSWLLFTGLVGAWLSAVFIIPKIKAIDEKHKMMTYPDFLRHRFGEKVALTAALISGLGYLGFTGAQVLAGAKLASSTLITTAPFGLSPMQFSLYVIAVIIIGYTVLGGLKAVVYTDTVQWLVLLIGLIFVAIPLSLKAVGGFAGLREALPPSHFSLLNIKPVTFINWMVTIIPIWLIGMTLYQRMYAVKDENDAKKAWYIAGFFEYPLMAFMGVVLGMCARVLFPDVQPETGLPLLIAKVMPIGLRGIVVAAFFSAIMSTADSCLMASSGNFLNDFLQRYFFKDASEKTIIRLSQAVTLLIGVFAIVLASQFKEVLNAILYAYSFMVSGLFVPTLGAFFWKKSSSIGALWAMISGGTLTLMLILFNAKLPYGLDETVFGIALSAVVFVSLSLLFPDKEREAPLEAQPEK